MFLSHSCCVLGSNPHVGPSRVYIGAVVKIITIQVYLGPRSFYHVLSQAWQGTPPKRCPEKPSPKKQETLWNFDAGPRPGSDRLSSTLKNTPPFPLKKCLASHGQRQAPSVQADFEITLQFDCIPTTVVPKIVQRSTRSCESCQSVKLIRFCAFGRSESQKLSARSFFSQLGQKRLQSSAPFAPLTAR